MFQFLLWFYKADTIPLSPNIWVTSIASSILVSCAAIIVNNNSRKQKQLEV